ncbi:MAG: hypothetical protein AB2417_12795 [Clostridiaceae bacterium]
MKKIIISSVLILLLNLSSKSVYACNNFYLNQPMDTNQQELYKESLKSLLYLIPLPHQHKSFRPIFFNIKKAPYIYCGVFKSLFELYQKLRFSATIYYIERVYNHKHAQKPL